MPSEGLEGDLEMNSISILWLACFCRAGCNWKRKLELKSRAVKLNAKEIEEANAVCKAIETRQFI
eukprot:1157819-Pelagomonas_calceolata.AAC.1